MGVSGSGKTTLGDALSRALGRPFVDADTLHPPANVAKMSAGIPLDDADRAPWLAAVAGWLRQHPGGVVACSALKRRYRDVLRAAGPVRFVHLHLPEGALAARLVGRAPHFMPGSLLRSQLEALEPLGPDERGLTLDGTQRVEDLVRHVLRQA